MTPEIKQRIEQIKNGEIPEGYKRTKAGIIPEKWEIKKLSDVLKKQTQKNTNNEIQNVLTNSATQGIVCQTEYFDKQIANNENTSGYYIVKPGYFVYNPRISVSAPCGPFNRYNGDKDGIMSPLYSVYCFCDKSITYANFLTYYFSSSKWYAYMNSIANYGARSDRMNVTGEDMNNMPIPYPPLPEQQKIVAILSAQDKVIECYEKKIEQLKRIKKYYLQNMFPKRGETVPKIRFKGFTDSWISKRFSEFSWISGKRNKDDLDLEPYAITNEHGFIPQSEAHDEFGYMEKTDRKAYIIVSSNSFAYNPARINVGSIGYYKGLKNVIVSSLYEVFKTADSICDNFLWHWFKTAEFSKWIKRLQEGSVRQYFYYDKMCEVKLYIPSLQEQKKIADTFNALDSIINYHQRKLDEEKKKKKALQQLLLTGIVRVNHG